jgi:hypothetical protein
MRCFIAKLNVCRTTRSLDKSLNFHYRITPLSRALTDPQKYSLAKTHISPWQSYLAASINFSVRFVCDSESLADIPVISSQGLSGIKGVLSSPCERVLIKAKQRLSVILL